MAFTTPEASDWIQQYYEDYFRQFMTEAEWKVLRDEWDYEHPDYFASGYGGNIPWEARYAKTGLANYGISLEDFIDAMNRLNAARAGKGPIYGQEALEEFYSSVLGPQWQLYILGGDYGGIGADFNPNEALLLASGIYYTVPTGFETKGWDRGPGYYDHLGNFIAATEAEALAYLKSQPGYVEPGYTPPEYPAFQAPPTPPTPFMPQWKWAEEVTGIKPGERIRPGQYKVPSGQTLKRMSPSEMAGLGGLVEWSAGRAPGAHTGAPDYWKEAMNLLPTTQPRGTVRWATSPYR